MHLITTTSDLETSLAPLADADFVAVDTEFLRETTYWPKLCLIQIAGQIAGQTPCQNPTPNSGKNSGQDSSQSPGAELAFIIDPLAPGIDLAPFYRLLANDSVLKVFHAGRQDIEIFTTASGRVPHPVFDSQVAAMVCGFGESVSYANLVKKLTNEDLDKSSRFTDWSRRPLSESQLVYALGDVTHLVRIYRLLKAELETTGRAAWLDEEMAVLTDLKTYALSPEDAWRRLKLRVKSRKSLAVLVALATWRESLAQAQNVPRGRILRDDALYDIANQMPTTVETLGELRSLSDGFSRSARAREILEAVRNGLALDPKTLPALTPTQHLSAEAGATVELLRVLLKAEAARHRVAPRLIASSEDLERLAAETDPDIPALKGWRRQVYGETALQLKAGKIALSLAKGEVVAAPLT